MKKILALLLALVMLLTLAACGDDKTETPESTTSTPTSSVPATSVPASTGSSEGTSQTPDSTPPTSETPDTQAPATQPPATAGHTHSYTSSVTTAVTCNTDGVKTFTCSCGNTYTEKIASTGHSWGEWETIENPTVTQKGKAQRKCANCSATESKDLDKLALPFDNMFNGGNALAVSCLQSSGMTTEGMLNFCSYEIFHSYIYENVLSSPLPEKHKITVAQRDFYFDQYAVPEDVVLPIIEKHFSLMEDFWYDMLRSSDRYDSTTKTFRCTSPIWFTGFDATVLAYEHLAGDDYQLYLEARVNDHPHAPCSECATTDSCVLDRTKLSLTVCCRPGYTPFIIFYGTCNAIPDSAIPMN